MDMSGLLTPVSDGGTNVDLANRIDEKPRSPNWKLADVEYAHGSVGG